MVHTRCNHGWPRRGFALLWESDFLAELVKPDDVLSLRQFFALVDNWPDSLPAAGGNAMIVSGLEGCLEVLGATDAEKWLESDLRSAVLSFQDYFEGQAGLILWLPSGRSKISMNRATEEYFWKHRETGGEGLPLGRLLFSGAESEVVRIMDTDERNTDPDGKHWIGLHHPRIS